MTMMMMIVIVLSASSSSNLVLIIALHIMIYNRSMITINSEIHTDRSVLQFKYTVPWMNQISDIKEHSLYDTAT